MIFRIKYFVTPSGKRPLYEFFDEAHQKDPEMLVAIVASISKMRNRDNWGGRLSKQIRGKIYQIRADSSHHFGRVFYCTLPDRSLLLFNGYMKTTNKVDPRELAKAEGMEHAFKLKGGSYELFTEDQ
jgi:hypothetical protein